MRNEGKHNKHQPIHSWISMWQMVDLDTIRVGDRCCDEVTIMRLISPCYMLPQAARASRPTVRMRLNQ